MTSARRVISVKKEVVGKNIVARIDGANANDLIFLNTDGVNLSFHLRDGDFFVFDQNLNLVAQRKHAPASGTSRGRGQVYSPTTLLGGSSYAGTMVLSTVFHHALYKIDGPSLTVPATPQQSNAGDGGPTALNKLFIQTDSTDSLIYTACSTNSRDVIIVKYDTSFTEQARTYVDAEARMLIGFVRGGTTLYVVTEDVNYHLVVLAYDLNLNLIGRIAYTDAATLGGQVQGAFFHNGFIYIATPTRNPNHLIYDIALWKISQDLTSYDAAFIDTSTGGTTQLGTYGNMILSNGNVAVVGARVNSGNYNLTVLEYDSVTLDLVSQIEDTTDLGGTFENCATTSIGDSIYIAIVGGSSVYITRLDNRDFPVATTPICDSRFTWQNILLPSMKISGSFLVTTPATPVQNFSTTSINMADSATSYSLAAQCEF